MTGWAFRQLFADVLARHPHDPEIASILDRAEAVGHLRLACLEEPTASRLAGALKDTASSILAGKTQSGIVDCFNDRYFLEGRRDTVTVRGDVSSFGRCEAPTLSSGFGYNRVTRRFTAWATELPASY